MFKFISTLNRDVTGAVIDAATRALGSGSFAGAFDAAAALAAQQLLLMPYYFAFSHQNRERPDLSRVGLPPRRSGAKMRVAAFTDTFDDVNGVARFTRDIATQAARAGRTFTVLTCTPAPAHDAPYRVNFRPLASCALPGYARLGLNLPPVPEVLEYADRQQFDAVYVDTPGPMGLVGLLVAAVLRVPVVGTYHTNFPEYVDALTGDHRLSVAAAGYVRWFYGRMATVFCRTRQSRAAVASLGIADERLAVAPAGVDDATFNPGRQDSDLWNRLGVREPRRLLYCGRVSVEKGLPLLADAFAALCRGRRDVALVVAGDGPCAAEMARRLKGLPAYFLGFQRDGALGPLYASSDLFAFPSRTDTMGQVVLEAQACGLPVLVSDAGGPSEVMDDDVTGLVVRGQTPAAWASAFNSLLDDDARRQRMARSGPSRMARYSMAKAFDGFWDEIARAAGVEAGATSGSDAPEIPSQPELLDAR